MAKDLVQKGKARMDIQPAKTHLAMEAVASAVMEVIGRNKSFTTLAEEYAANSKILTVRPHGSGKK